MGAVTGIKWTDSTYNYWWGCTKVGPPCDHCYAEGVDKRSGGEHWGLGAPRRLLSEHARNECQRWQRQAQQFADANGGQRRKVFCSSMSDIFDNEVPIEWCRDALDRLELCTHLDVQLLTKRLPLVAKRIPPRWKHSWPRHIGLMVTCGDQEEGSRDFPRLKHLKEEFGIPWVGVSYEPALDRLDFTEWCGVWWNQTTGLWKMSPKHPPMLDWIIFGGESGPNWRPIDWAWAESAARVTRASQLHWGKHGTRLFIKQAAAMRPTDAMIPDHLRIREFPPQLSGLLAG